MHYKIELVENNLARMRLSIGPEKGSLAKIKHPPIRHDFEIVTQDH